MRKELPVTLGMITNGDCPEGLADMAAGYISEGIFYTSNSVAEHFFLSHRDRRTSARGEDKRVYFIGDGDRVKIGIAANPQQRLMALQTASGRKLELKATCGGGRSEEQRLHAQFAADRLTGEWFLYSPELLAFIDTLAQGVSA